MKPFELIIKVDENGRPGFRFEPNELHTVVETMQLLELIKQVVGATQIGGKPVKEDQSD